MNNFTAGPKTPQREVQRYALFTRYICSIWEAVALIIDEAYRLTELEEVLGELLSVDIAEIGLVATIGKISVWLPEELAEQLKGLIGRRVAILRLDGYHLRCLDEEDQS